MSPRVMTVSQAIEQERWRWKLYRPALSAADQETFDRMFECAKRQLLVEIQHGRQWGFEAVLMAVMVEHEKRVGEIVRQFRQVCEDKDRA